MEEKKAYSIIGQVTIGTDEYRDLIEGRIAAEKQVDYYRDKYWAEQSKSSELQKQVEALQSKIEKCEKFIKKNSVNISEDAVTLFVSLFGEEK